MDGRVPGLGVFLQGGCKCQAETVDIFGRQSCQKLELNQILLGRYYLFDGDWYCLFTLQIPDFAHLQTPNTLSTN